MATEKNDAIVRVRVFIGVSLQRRLAALAPRRRHSPTSCGAREIPTSLSVQGPYRPGPRPPPRPTGCPVHDKPILTYQLRAGPREKLSECPPDAALPIRTWRRRSRRAATTVDCVRTHEGPEGFDGAWGLAGRSQCISSRPSLRPEASAAPSSSPGSRPRPPRSSASAPAIEAAFWMAKRTTLVGSMTPASIRFS